MPVSVMPSMKRRWANRKAITSGAMMTSAGRHQRPVTGAGLVVAEVRDRQRRRLQMLAVQHDQRPEIVVPVRHHREDAERGHGRDRGRQHHAPDDAELGNPVHPRRVDQIIRHGLEELPHQENAEHRDRERQHQRCVAVEYAELVQQQEHRDGGRLRRNQDAEHDEREQHVAPEKAQLRERVGGRQRNQHLKPEDRNRDNQPVEQIAP